MEGEEIGVGSPNEVLLLFLLLGGGCGCSCASDVVFYFLEGFDLEVDLLVGVVALVVLVGDEVLHLVAEQLDLGHAAHEAPHHLQLLQAVVADQLVHHLLHRAVAQQHLAPPHPVELLVVQPALPVVTPDCVDRAVQLREEQAELVHQAVEGDVALRKRSACLARQRKQVQLRYRRQLDEIGVAALLELLQPEWLLALELGAVRPLQALQCLTALFLVIGHSDGAHHDGVELDDCGFSLGPRQAAHYFPQQLGFGVVSWRKEKQLIVVVGQGLLGV